MAIEVVDRSTTKVQNSSYAFRDCERDAAVLLCERVRVEVRVDLLGNE